MLARFWMWVMTRTPDRDFVRVVPQSKPMSCGAAALATLLREVHGEAVDEASVIDALGTDGETSLDDLRQAASVFGYKAEGYAADFEALERLRQPCVLHLRRLGQGHFVVLRGLGKDCIWIADPAAGNVRLSRQRFSRLWLHRAGEGRLLLVSAPGTSGEAATTPLQETPPKQILDLFPVTRRKRRRRQECENH